MARSSPPRELLYRLRLRPGAAPRQLPLLLAAAGDVTVETSVAHLDDDGHVWRILHVHGAEAAVAAAHKAFDKYRPPFLVESNVLASGRTRLVLWYKYRAPPGFSHTLAAFRVLGRDTVVTDRARGTTLTIRLLTRAGPALREYLALVRRETGPEFDLDVLHLGPPREEEPARLTAAEEATLAAASRLGYYSVPREAGVRDVARVMGLSASAAGYRLRQAEKKLVAAHLEGR